MAPNGVFDAAVIEPLIRETIQFSERETPMSLMTPRGLKVRLELSWAFGLLARLWGKDPRTDAFRVLKTCEAIESVPAVLCFIGGIVASWNKGWPAWSIPLGQVAGATLGLLLTQMGLFLIIRPIGLLFLGSIWSWTSGYGILLTLTLTNAWMTRGWQGPLWWVLGIFATTIAVKMILEWGFVALRWRIGGKESAFTSSEVNFFNAYRLHASRMGASQELDVSDEEIASGMWRECLLDYAAKYPEAVNRFPNQEEIAALIGGDIWSRQLRILVENGK